MNVEELVDVLKCLGLSDYESKAHSALLLKGHSKASHISRESDVPQSKIYEVLERLSEKRLIEVYNVRPKEFKPISPSTVLTSMIEQKEAEINQIKNKISSILRMLNSIQESPEGIWTSKEKSSEDFYRRACSIYERSNQYVYVLTKNFYWPTNVAESVRACVKRGVDVRVVYTNTLDESNYYRAKWLEDNGVEIRCAVLKLHPTLVDSDCKEVLLRLDGNQAKKEKFIFTTIYTRESSLVNVIDMYIKNLWKTSKPLHFR